MNDSTTTTAAIAASAPLALVPHTSDGLIYTAARDALDGFRADSETPAFVLGQIAQKIAAHKVAAERDAALIAFSRLPIVIATRGVFSVTDVAEGKVDFPEAGDLGFTLSILGFKSLSLPDAAAAEGKSKKNGMYGLAVYPAHSVDAAISTEKGKAWLQGIIAKELGLVAFRGLRVTAGETTIGDMIESALVMPAALSDYTERTQATGEAFATFKELWPAFKIQLASTPSGAKLAAALPSKRDDMLSAIRSKVFAETKFPGLEKENLFVRVANAFAAKIPEYQAAYEEAGKGAEFTYSASDVTRWIEGRDTLDLMKIQVEGVDASDLADALAGF